MATACSGRVNNATARAAGKRRLSMVSTPIRKFQCSSRREIRRNRALPRSRAGARTRWLEDMPLQSRAMQDGRGDLLNRAAGRIDGGDALSRHELLGLAHLVATIVERRIAAAGPPHLADLLQSLCI